MTTHCQRSAGSSGGGGASTPFAGNTPGNGHAVQLASGRLVVPMYGGTPAGASTCYSDDGKTWTVGTNEMPVRTDRLDWIER